MSTSSNAPVIGLARSQPRLLNSILVVALGAGAVGCAGDREQVRAYRIPKGPAPEVAAAAMQQVPPPPAAPMAMQWDLPEGWTLSDNPNPMRFATLVAGEGDDAIEVAISQLGGAAGGIVANINRWRGQVGLEPESQEQLAQAAQPIDAAGARGVLVDLDGPSARMLAAIFPTETHTWFIKTTAPKEALDVHKAGFVTLCSSVRFSGVIPDADGSTAPAAPAPAPSTGTADAGGAAGAASGGPTWGELPAGWTLDSPARAMSVASFTVAGEGGEASMTITPLGGAQDELANVNRWRRQVGLDPVAELAEQAPEPIEVGGLAGSLVDIGGVEQRTLGVIVTDGSTTWFYKLTGPDALVAEQKDAFATFVRSVRPDGEDG
ncbi:MAG: hypothetical protein ACYTJ0_08590 [Planctomycetota bacterium]|jgi:hypothetical protein